MTDSHARVNRTATRETGYFMVGKVMVVITPGPLDTPCHVWRGATAYGYPSKGNRDGRVVRGHREAYETAYGPIPRGHEIHHLCGNRRCINPEHLEALTRSEHVERHRELSSEAARTAASSRDESPLSDSDGRLVLSETCKRGHSWTPENTLPHPTGRGRLCATCKRQARRKERTR